MDPRGAAGARADMEGASQHLFLVIMTACLLLLEHVTAISLAKGNAANMAIAERACCLVSWSQTEVLAPRDYPLPSVLALSGRWSSFEQAHRSDPWMDTVQARVV